MGVREWWERLGPKQRAYALRLLVLVGAGTTLLVVGGWPTAAPTRKPALQAPAKPVATSPWVHEEQQLARQLQTVLGAIPGVHKLTVAVQLKRTAIQEYLSNQDSTAGTPLVIQSGNGQAVVPLDEVGPEVVGVVVVTPSAADPVLRQELAQAVETLLGVSAYQVLVLPDGQVSPALLGAGATK